MDSRKKVMKNKKTKKTKSKEVPEPNDEFMQMDGEALQKNLE